MGTPVSFARLNVLFQSSEEDTQYEAQGEAEPGKRMWMAFMKDAEKFDNGEAKDWKGDSDSILVFSGLLSATVGAFIIEFYKKLLPDSGNQTVDLLCQISQQLPNFVTGTCLPPQAGQSFSPGASIVWANSMWIMSLILSLTSALFATLAQQWARKYIQMPQTQSDPNKCARIRSFLFSGTRKYNMHIAFEAAYTLLHFSIFLFFAGLAIHFFSINKAVAIAVSLSVGIFVAAYFVLTILPCIEFNCPYRTPMSNIWWYVWHTSLFLGASCLHYLLTKLGTWLLPSNPDEIVRHRQHITIALLNSLTSSICKHEQWFKDGCRETILREATEGSDSVDVKALAWWLQLPALAEAGKAQGILECIPRETVVQLMVDPIEAGKRAFLKHLIFLLRSCRPDLLAFRLDEEKRKTRLRVCLHSIRHIVHAFVNQQSDDHLVDVVRSNLPNTSHIWSMWADSDVGIRITSRSIYALLARCLLYKPRIEGSELRWLQDVIGESPNVIYNSDDATRDRMNLKAFVYGLLSGQEGDLSIEDAIPFTETLAILMNAGVQSPFDRIRFQDELSALIGRIEQDPTEGSGEIVDKLRRMFEDFLPTPAPVPMSTHLHSHGDPDPQ